MRVRDARKRTAQGLPENHEQNIVGAKIAGAIALQLVQMGAITV
jgi:hypothetical protein